MKNLFFVFFLLLSAVCFSQDCTIVQINAYWNESNTRRDLERVAGCEYILAYLEDQPKSVKDKVFSVPSVLIYKDGALVKSYQAGIDLKLSVPFKEIQNYIYLLKNS